MPIPSILNRIIIILWRYVLCPLGYHVGKNDPAANFCDACGFQLKPDAYHNYIVKLKDGEKFSVLAVNEHHAKSLVIYGGDNLIDGHTGQSLATVKIHPDHIASVNIV